MSVMEVFMEVVRIKDDFIKLGQAMKLSGMADSGVDAKDDIISGKVKVNNEIELRRGRKLYNGDIVEFSDKKFEIVSSIVN